MPVVRPSLAPSPGDTIRPLSRPSPAACAARVRALATALESPPFAAAFVDAYIRDTGFTWREVWAREIATPARLLRLQAEQTAGETGRLPVGQVAVMMPKNSLGLTLAKAVASAYLAGNTTVVYLPRQLTASAPLYASLLREQLGSTQVRIAHGDAGARFLEMQLAQPACAAVVIYGDDTWIETYVPLGRAHGKKLIFEGPGNDPLIVWPGADLDQAVDGAVRGGLNNGGQSCSALERFFVHVELYEDFTRRLIDRLAALRLGSPFDPATAVGPLASPRVWGRLHAQLRASVARGARVRWGGSSLFEPVTGRPLLQPAVLTGCRPDMPVVRDETFGPVFPLLAFAEADGLLAALDATAYGLNTAAHGPLPPAVQDYLLATHRNVYWDSTAVCPHNLPTRLTDGGYKRSGLLWDFWPGADPRDAPRSGRRNLFLELSHPVGSDRPHPLER